MKKNRFRLAEHFLKLGNRSHVYVKEFAKDLGLLKKISTIKRVYKHGK